MGTIARLPALVRLFARDYSGALARFPLQAAEGDTAGYYLLQAELHRAGGDTTGARAAWDSARVILEALVGARRANTAIGVVPVEELLAVTYASLGRKAAAIQAGRARVQRLPVSRDAVSRSGWLLRLVEVHVQTGEYGAALAQLEYSLSIPSLVSMPLLRADPLYAPLRGNPRFERLLRGKP